MSKYPFHPTSLDAYTSFLPFIRGINTISLLLLTALVFTACIPGPQVDGETQKPDQSVVPIPTRMTAYPGSLFNPDDAAVVAPTRLAVIDLASHLGITIDQVGIGNVLAAEWYDRSLGCPWPGIEYESIYIQGFRVELIVSGDVYIYHTDRGETVVMCDEEQGIALQPPKTSGVEDPEMETQPGTGNNVLVSLAVADLASRLEIAPEEIELVKFEEVVWPDSAIGCPQPGMQYLQVISDGARITLSVGEREYAYHSGGSREPFLCESLFSVTEPKSTPLTGILPDPGNK